MVSAMRDLPMPGLARDQHDAAVAPFACSQRRISRSISSSRPTSGVVARAQRLEPALDRALPHHLLGLHRLVEALRLVGAEIAVLEQTAEQTGVFRPMTTVPGVATPADAPRGSASRRRPLAPGRRPSRSGRRRPRAPWRSLRASAGAPPPRASPLRRQCQRRPHRLLGVILVGLRITEIDQHPRPCTSPRTRRSSWTTSAHFTDRRK